MCYNGDSRFANTRPLGFNRIIICWKTVCSCIWLLRRLTIVLSVVLAVETGSSAVTVVDEFCFAQHVLLYCPVCHNTLVQHYVTSWAIWFHQLFKYWASCLCWVTFIHSFTHAFVFDSSSDKTSPLKPFSITADIFTNYYRHLNYLLVCESKFNWIQFNKWVQCLQNVWEYVWVFF